ncbi:hypothetical protein EAS64_31630 [Trebonia kvetii]|uniref:FUSC family protein n=1 Tax=Trebonia kvetii TaxID=2480626 RepID=A0A6P2BSE6_9ACTN|nr:hypothetical protein EAS64_31630 [Trebonia kvetii]
MSLGLRRNQRATQISAAARTITQRAPVTLTLARHRAQPTAASIIRLATCAVFAYLIALPVPETSPPVLAPLTAIIVLQVSIYQTLFSAVRRVAAVMAGVLIALGLSRWIGFTWWKYRAHDHARARSGVRAAAARGRPRGRDQRDAHPVGRQQGGGDQQDNRDIDRHGRGADRRVRPHGTAGRAGRGSDRGPRPHDGRPARPDGGRAERRVR